MYNKSNTALQNKLQNMVITHVYCDVTDMVNYILSTVYNNSGIVPPFTYENMVNDTVQLEDGETESKDITSYFMVSTTLGEALEELGEAIIYNGIDYIWGRTESGQTVYMDDIMWQVATKWDLI